VGVSFRIAWRAPKGWYGTHSIMAISEVGVEIRKLVHLFYRSNYMLQFLKWFVAHDTMQGVLCGIMCFSWKRRSGPTNLLYHGLDGRCGIMPSIYVVFGF
jgi:hypothetical protein